uniref:Transmembrane protein n=1 Tax=Globodera rostochiensis TaxID=31243 RepID=A0A914IA60_GLORO
MSPKKRTPSRGRPPGRRSVSQGRRPQSASRKVAATKATDQLKRTRELKSKSPTKKKTTTAAKVTPTVSKVPTRKVATAPAMHRRSRSPARSSQRQAKASASFVGKSIPNSHGIPHVNAITVSTSSSYALMSSPSPASVGRPSPPQLRSRITAAHNEHQQKLSPRTTKTMGAKGTEGWRVVEALKATPGAMGRQMDKLGKSLKGGPRPLLKRTGVHLRRHWKYWLLMFVLLLLGAFLYKFQREVLKNVQQTRKQMVDFVNEQYEQKRQIFGEQWQQAMDAMEWTRQKYLSEYTEQRQSLPAGKGRQIPSTNPSPRGNESPPETNTN